MSGNPRLKPGEVSVALLRDGAGRRTFTLSTSRIEAAVHVLVLPEHRTWGYVESWWNGPLHFFGVGRLLLVTWTDPL